MAKKIKIRTFARSLARQRPRKTAPGWDTRHFCMHVPTWGHKATVRFEERSVFACKKCSARLRRGAKASWLRPTVVTSFWELHGGLHCIAQRMTK
jgi:hypothetical protein